MVSRLVCASVVAYGRMKETTSKPAGWTCGREAIQWVGSGRDRHMGPSGGAEYGREGGRHRRKVVEQVYAFG